MLKRACTVDFIVIHIKYNLCFIAVLCVFFIVYIRSQGHENKDFIARWVISQEEPGAGGLPLTSGSDASGTTSFRQA